MDVNFMQIDLLLFLLGWHCISRLKTKRMKRILVQKSRAKKLFKYTQTGLNDNHFVQPSFVFMTTAKGLVGNVYADLCFSRYAGVLK